MTLNIYLDCVRSERYEGASPFKTLKTKILNSILKWTGLANTLITASKPTTCLLDPVPTKLLKELLPAAEEPLLNIINSSLSLGHVPKPFKQAVIKPLIKKPKLDPCELTNYRPISNLPFM